jgi:hypothetical protein
MATALTISCSQCGKQISVPESAVGKRGRCGACQHQFVIEPPSLTALESQEEDYGLAPAEAAPTIPAVARKAAWQETAPTVTGGKSQGQAALDAVARQKHKPRYEITEYLTMAVILGVAGIMLASLLIGVVIWLVTMA